MKLNEILGHKNIINHLTNSVNADRIPHAQLFIGFEGSGTLAVAIAYSQMVLRKNLNNKNILETESYDLKFESFSHPDLHFIYPTVTTENVKTKPKSIDFIKNWRFFLKEKPYGSLFDWYSLLQIQNKQGEIRVDDAQEILKTLALKSYEGGYKIMIIWMAEKMNSAASNKLLKLLEEPPEKTLFILIAENEEEIIQTIRSRCQIINFRQYSNSEIIDALITNYSIDVQTATNIAHQSQGNYNKALQLLHDNDEELPFGEWFVEWVRAAFRAKGNASSILNLITWSEKMASLGRESQKLFLNYCTEMFRQALLLNYQANKLVYLDPNVEKFKLENFAPFVNGNNINDIFREISEAQYHIERNGNAKIIFTDLSIRLTRLIHKK